MLEKTFLPSTTKIVFDQGLQKIKKKNKAEEEEGERKEEGGGREEEKHFGNLFIISYFLCCLGIFCSSPCRSSLSVFILLTMNL